MCVCFSYLFIFYFFGSCKLNACAMAMENRWAENTQRVAVLTKDKRQTRPINFMCECENMRVRVLAKVRVNRIGRNTNTMANRGVHRLDYCGYVYRFSVRDQS